MKYLKLFIVLIIIYSCENNNAIKEFENTLGKENSTTLSYLVSDFENDFLKKQYPNFSKNEAYENFLYQISIQDTQDFRTLSKKSKTVFDESELKYELNKCVDSTWVIKDSIKSEFEHVSLKIGYLTKYRKAKNDLVVESNQYNHLQYIAESKIDSLLEKQSNVKTTNTHGNYWNGLKIASENNKFIAEYIESTERSGDGIIPFLLSKKMLDSNLDYSDYFIKRIIVSEFAY